jgi:integrase
VNPRQRDKAKSTRYPGVRTIVPGELYVIRASWIESKTGRKRSFHEQVEATSLEAALEIRLGRLQDAKSGTAVQAVPRLLVFAKSWLNSKKDEVGPSTHEKYVFAVAHIAERFGDFFLDRITEKDILEWRGELRSDYANSTINGYLRTFRTMMDVAVRRHRLDVNPLDGVKQLKESKESKCLSEEELRDLLDAMREVGPQWYPLTLTLALTGMRPGAATALRWSDIDFEKQSIIVERAHWRGILGETKTKVRRELGLPPALADVLRDHRREMFSAQHPGHAAGWVFASSKGTLRNSGCLTKPLRAACEKAGIEKPVSAGWFRHTLSNLVRERAGLHVQKAITGHTTDRMALHYSDVNLNERLAVVIDIESKVSPQASHLAASKSDEKNSDFDEGSEAQ